MGEEKSEETIYYVSSKSRVIAIALCCLGFLGLGGFQRFYVKKWLTGLLYLLTFGIKIVVPIALVFFALNQATAAHDAAIRHQQQQQEQALQQKQQELAEAAKQKQSGKQPLTELELLENFKTGYRDGNYGASGGALDTLRKKYPDSPYISMLEKDYPDLPAKLQVVKAQHQAEMQKRDAEDQAKGDAFNNTMSQFSIYAGYGTGEGNLKFRVFVTSDWYSLDKGRKMAFAQRAYQVMQLCGLDYPMFEIRCRSNGRRVAHHGDLFGMSIDE